MDTELLKTFMIVADSGGLSACASVLGIPQSLVSRRVKELETLCSAKLLYRHGRGVVLTPAGHELYKSAGGVLENLAQIISGLADKENVPAGVVSLAVSQAVGSAIGVQFLFEMQKLYPLVRVQLVSAHSRHLLEWMIQGRIDIAILNESGLSLHVVSEPVGAINMVLACSPEFDFPFRTAKTIRFDELGSMPLVVQTTGTGVRRQIDLAAGKGNIALQITFEVDDIALTKQLAATGRVAALLPRMAVMQEVAEGSLIARQLTSPQIASQTVMATAKNRPITASMKAAMSVLKSVAAATFR